MRTTRALATLAIAGLAFGLTACGDDSEAAEETTTAATEKPSATPEEEATEDGDASEDASDDKAEDAPGKGDGSSPDWAKPTTTSGEKLTTIEGEGFTVDVYQVGTTAATKTGSFVDPDTNKPLVDVGDEIVYVNYVMTNTGSEPISLSYSLVSVDARYADWPYLGGMDGITDRAVEEEMGVTTSAIAPGSGDAPFLWAPGQAFSFGENFKYQANSPITFEVRLTPADDSGDLVHDQKQEVTGEATIK